jgi:hypothetical protein
MTKPALARHHAIKAATWLGLIPRNNTTARLARRNARTIARFATWARAGPPECPL